MKHYTILAIIICSLTNYYGQKPADFLFFDGESTHLNTRKIKTTSQNPTVKKFKEGKFVAHLILDVYSQLISSQDGSRCGFYPTCSGYCRRAIRKNGLILGGIQACDRFTRCNGLSPERYTIDIKRLKMIDHVP